MPKKGPELCMFCEAAPCECEGVAPKPKQKAAPRKRAAKAAGKKPATSGGEAKEEATKEEAVPDVVADGNAEPSLWGGATGGRRKRKRMGGRPIGEHQAIYNLHQAGLLDASEARRFADVITPPLSGKLAAAHITGGDEHVSSWPEEGDSQT
ncbi:hypothetical protein SEA_DIABLA_76 [Gordonia phage Diabla]|nr:hypothetical protein SEA_DIABLA_76 [Gordonia phage Diabla]